jgi:hypothetical protein
MVIKFFRGLSVAVYKLIDGKNTLHLQNATNISKFANNHEIMKIKRQINHYGNVLLLVL